MDERMEKILQSIKESSKKVDILPMDEGVLEKILNSFEIKRNSLLGTIIHNTGGIIIEDWIRIYGAGNANFYQRNQEFFYDNILIAEDILGGLYTILDSGTVGYFAPDTLEWEDNELNYSQFLYWCLHGDTNTYYKEYRWNTWKKDVSNLAVENGIAFYPFLWADAKLEKRHRTEIPMEEIIRLEFDFASQRKK